MLLTEKSELMKHSLQFFILLLSTTIFSQSTYEGKIIDAAGASVPFAHVTIENTYTGTIANQHGDFKLHFPEGATNFRIVFSAVGYKNRIIDIREAGPTIILLEDMIQLQEVVVVPRDYARELIDLASANIKINYPNREEKLTGFLREFTYWEDSGKTKPLYVAESVIESIKESYESKNKQGIVKLIEGRNYEGPGLEYLDTKIYAGSHHPHRFDLVMKREEFLSNPDAFEFTLTDTLRNEGQNMFVVSYVGGKNKPSGNVYIMDSTYAISKVEVRFTEFSILDDERQMLNYDVSYSKGKDGLWRLQQTSYLTKFIKQGGYLMLDSDYITTDITNEDTSIPYPERIHFRDYLLQKTATYNPDFWENYNILLADSYLEKLFKTSVVSDAKNNTTQETTEEKSKKISFIDIVRKIRFGYVISHTDLQINSHSITYSNSQLAIDQNDVSRAVSVVNMNSRLEYIIGRGFFVGINSSIPLTHYKLSNFEINVTKQFNLNPKGRPILLMPRVGFVRTNILHSLGKFEGTNNFKVNGKKFDSGTTLISLNQKSSGFVSALGLGVELGGKTVLFAEASMAHFFHNEAGLFFDERKEFFGKKSIYLPNNEEGLIINRNHPFEQLLTISIGTFYRF